MTTYLNRISLTLGCDKRKSNKNYKVFVRHPGNVLGDAAASPEKQDSRKTPVDCLHFRLEPSESRQCMGGSTGDMSLDPPVQAGGKHFGPGPEALQKRGNHSG